MKVFKIISIIAAVSILFYACEKIDPPYKEDQDPPEPPDTTSVLKKVLLEDYTGHDCVNCPTAAVVAEDLKELYGKKLIVLAVHAGFFARPKADLPQDFRTEAGEDWDAFFGVSLAGNPNGIVNRVERSEGDYIFNVGEWGPAIAAELEKEAEAKITIENSFAQNKLTTNITSEFLTMMDTTTTYHLLYCITQDSIIGPQMNNDANVGETPKIEDYVFMHMLRYSNSSWGEKLTDDNPVVVGKEYEMEITVNFEAGWVPKNCHVVAFIFNQETKTIIQVEEAKVIE